MRPTLLRVLFIEDSADDADLVLRLLRKEGFEPVSRRVESEQELQAALEGTTWDVVIADHSIPRLPSARALAIVRQKDLDVPFLVVSGTIRENDAVELMKAGASDYLLKDRLARLAPAVRRELDEARLRREHRLAQAEIERAHERYRSLIDNAVVGVFRSDDAGRFTFVNQALVAMLGYRSAEELLDVDPARDLFRDPAEAERVVTAGRGGRVEGTEVRWQRRDGAVLQVRLWGRVITNGATHGQEMIVEDVTELRQLQRQLEQAQKMEAVGRLAGGIVHDFNNLLVAILGYADLLRTTLNEEDDERLRSVEQIRRAGERAASLTRQLLAFSRRQVLERTVLNLNDVVNEVQAMLGRLIGEDVCLRTHLAADLPNIVADRGQVEQVLMNLAVNARDAMRDGGELTIETSAVVFEEPRPAVPRVLAPGRYVRLLVKDTGDGMSEEVKAHLFEPFFTTKEKGKGTGLGLSMVYGIVTQCDGAIAVTSEPGVGTRFDLYFPPTELTAARAPEAPPPRPTLAAQRGGETLLFVEDDPDVLAIAREILQRAGFRVLTASTGKEALEVLRAHAGPVHALVTDIVLPDTTGIALVEEVRAERDGLPVLYTSGYAAEEIDLAALERERAPFLQKPFTINDLVGKIRSVLEPR